MAYRDYICCRDCKSKFIYDGNDSIRNSLEATYGDEDATNWTVEIVCPNCLARLERNPLTEEEVSNLARTMVKGGKSVNWLCRAIEREHGIVSSQMQHIADLEAALAQPEQLSVGGDDLPTLTKWTPQRQPLTKKEICEELGFGSVDVQFVRMVERAHGIGDLSNLFEPDKADSEGGEL